LTARVPLLASRREGGRRKRRHEDAGRTMRVMRRLLLIAIVLAAPVAAVAAIYFVSVAMLQATNRTIEPQVLHYSAVAEYAVFLFLAVIEAKNRW
jgi:type III secretory pathway component EscS